MLNKEILKIIACPRCKKDVILKEEKIICVSCNRQYPIKNNIPIMIVEEAELNENIR
ncbi:MAG: Trm112 family protein [Candidatus Omnitrophica bacterium]|nr:Trm112 family protein [Candidatus Omnitrophota bacterium]